MAAAASKTSLHIFLDTNALFTEAADRLIATEISQFIVKSAENDLKMRWHIPSVVVGERRFQMFEGAKRLLPHLEKVEKLLGHHLGITEDVLSARVDDAIKRQIQMHDLNEVGFDHASVDWQEMVARSISRKPPFDEGENEKGFRDAIVLESFCQLASGLPKSLQACRIILLSNDERLVEAARERTADRNNIAFAKDLDAVKTILNALVSEITQETVNALLPLASNLFFQREDAKTLYYSGEIQKKIRSMYPDEFNKIPQGATRVSMKSITITTPPTFLVKEGQSLTFSSRIVFGMEAVKYVQRPQKDYNPFWPGATTGAHSGQMGPSGFPVTGMLPLGSTGPGEFYFGTPGRSGNTEPNNIFRIGEYRPPQYDEINREGEIVFEAKWTATLTSTGKLTRPKLLGVEHKSTNWNES